MICRAACAPRSPNHVIVTLSILEIYNENIRDLLQEGKRINLRSLPNEGTFPILAWISCIITPPPPILTSIKVASHLGHIPPEKIQ